MIYIIPAAAACLIVLVLFRRFLSMNVRIAELVRDLEGESKALTEVAKLALTWEDRYTDVYEQAQELRIANKQRREELAQLRTSVRDRLGMLRGYGYRNKKGLLDHSKVFGQLKELVD